MLLSGPSSEASARVRITRTRNMKRNVIEDNSAFRQRSYHQDCILVDDEDSQHAESNWITIQTAQEHIYLNNTFRSA